MTTHSLQPVQTLLRPGTLTPHITWRFERKNIIVIFIVLCVVSLVAWLYVTQANLTAALNLQIEESRARIEHLSEINSDLEVQIAEFERLEGVAQKAATLGFEPPAQSLYLSVPDFPAQAAVSWQANPLDTMR